MNYNEKRVYLQTKLRNLERKHNRLIQLDNVEEELINLQSEINSVKNELNL